MSLNDTLRITVSVLVAVTFGLAAVLLRGDTFHLAANAVNCHNSGSCPTTYSESELLEFKDALCAELACAMKSDSVWGNVVACDSGKSIHETMSELMVVLGRIGFNAKLEYDQNDSDLLSIHLSNSFTERNNIGLRIDFIRQEDHLKVKGVHGLCSTLQLFSALRSDVGISTLTLQE